MLGNFNTMMLAVLCRLVLWTICLALNTNAEGKSICVKKVTFSLYNKLAKRTNCLNPGLAGFWVPHDD